MQPSDYDLPHAEWRPNQLETIQWLETQRDIILLESPTGSGKTSYAAALSQSRSVTALCKTKNLQLINYAGLYGFNHLMGRGNYPCTLSPALTASECLYSEDGGMHKCPSAQNCPYLVQKAVVQGSPKASLNYAYWLAARWPRENPPAVLVLDEADEVPDLVVDWAGCTVTAKDRLDWGLPRFPQLSGYEDPTSPTDSVSEATNWLEEAREVLLDSWKTLKELQDPKHQLICAKCLELGRKVRATLDCIRANSSDWYIRSGPGARTIGGLPHPGFVCRPLTARYHFKPYFNVSETVILMSATIGQPGPLAGELGIEKYEHRSVPSQWPPEMRQVLAPADAPALGGKAEPSAYEKQADMAVKLLKGCPPDWFGIALVTSKREAQAVAERLARRGLEDRVWVIPEKENGRWIGTDRQTELWQERKRKVPGSLMVSYNHWRGYDGLDEKILLVLKTPFGRLGEPGSYESDYVRYDGKRYHWRTANMLMQGCGRTRRGREEDYGPNNGLVCVLDSNWQRVRKYLSDDWLSAIIQ